MHKVPAQLPIGGTCRIAFVGEAPGAEEVATGRPFVGPSGRVFDKLLRGAGIEREQCLVTNVFDYELPRNQVKPLCVTQKEADTHDDFPQLKVPVEQGCYVPAAVALPQLSRLREELSSCCPNVVVALGGTAVWSLLAQAPFGRMKKMRGTIQLGILNPSTAGSIPLKCVPTYHPAYVLRNYAMFPLVLADLKKALRESTTPEYAPVECSILVPDSPSQVTSFLASLGPLAAVDIETVKGQIDNIGFSDGLGRAMSVPIFDANGGNYWHSIEDEVAVIMAICRYLEDPDKHKIFQNGGYDVQWLFERWGVATRGWSDDTRLLHHSLWPESPKDLGTIASLHLNMPAWKLMGAGRATTKKED